jgi:hypothetical protein
VNVFPEAREIGSGIAEGSCQACLIAEGRVGVLKVLPDRSMKVLDYGSGTDAEV